MALISVIQYQLKYYKHGGLKVCCNIYGACSPWLFDRETLWWCTVYLQYT